MRSALAQQLNAAIATGNFEKLALREPVDVIKLKQ